ncbi:MAG TPA: hypothetical protein VNS09_17795 [Solirubrobacter sp.]|nr:hypothetical protein [Solirubrobacter sp.]
MATGTALRGTTSAEPAEVVAAAHELGVHGWVRPTGELHAEGAPDALDAFTQRIEATGAPVRVEGHEQFALRGVPAGPFVVRERPRGYTLHFDGRTWALPKAPSMNPADKRFATETETGDETGAVWDEGTYERGGRVGWPEAFQRGHAVFVLHGAKLEGGFALQRTRPGAWLLIKRREGGAGR